MPFLLVGHSRLFGVKSMYKGVLDRPKVGMQEEFTVKGYVHWELVNDKTGKIVDQGIGVVERPWHHRFFLNLASLFPSFSFKRFNIFGTDNAIVNHARNKLAGALTGSSIVYPTFIGVGTGTNTVGASDTALQTVSQYDGSNDAKAATSRTLKGQFTSRIIAQFDTDEANVTIRELGLFEANDASQNMWARANVTIAKTSSDTLSVYWYIIFERRAGVAIKAGTSISATGTTVANTDSTLTFAAAVTIFTVHNNTGVVMYLKLNGAMTGSPPQNYDFVLQDGQSLVQSDEEVEVANIHVYLNSAIDPVQTSNLLTVQGW